LKVTEGKKGGNASRRAFTKKQTERFKANHPPRPRSQKKKRGAKKKKREQQMGTRHGNEHSPKNCTQNEKNRVRDEILIKRYQFFPKTKTGS